MAGLFDIEKVTFPSELKTSVPFTITGDLTLLSLPFYGLLWVVAKVTYPQEWWEIIGSPITTQTVMATLGKFSITFPKGFDREGAYLLDISAYLGPEKTESAGPVTSVSVEVPPFPALASITQANFTVSKTGPNDITGVNIVSYANGAGTPVTAPGALSLKVGDTCKVIVSFSYDGPATNKTLYAAIGKIETLLGVNWFNEILPGSVQIALPATTAATVMNYIVNIPITSAISPGDYSIYAKVDSTESPQLSDVITITGVPNSPVYTNVVLKSYDASVNMGDKCKTVLAFDYQGPVHTATVYCAIGNIDTVLLVKTFDEILDASVSQSLAAADTPTHYEVEVDIPITSAIDPTKSPYSVYGKVDSVISPEIEKVITIVGAAQPTVTNLIVTGYTTPVNIGDKCRVTVQYNYIGPAANLTLYSAIGHVDPVIGFNELVTGSVTLTMSATATQVTLTDYVDIAITSTTPASGSPYSVYAKIGNVISPIVKDVITVGGAATPTITNIAVTAYTTPVNIGDKCHVTVSFDYIGPATTQTLYSAIGHVDPIIGFNELVTGTASLSIPAAAATTAQTASVDITITSATPVSGNPYAVYAKIGSVISPTVKDVINVTTPNAPTLTLTPSVVNSGGTLSFTFSNFKPNTTVTITGTFGSITANSNSVGSGGGSFAAVGPAGPQTLTATDGTNTAHATFTITVSPTVTVSPTSIKSGSSLTYTYSNFAPNATITVKIIASDSSTQYTGTSQSDANGSGSGGLQINGIPGLYSLLVSDAAGNLTSASFKILENITGLAVTYSGTIPKVAVGYGMQCAATITNADGTIQDVSNGVYTAWSSSNPAVATVSNTGSVMGVSVGKVNITVTYTEPVAQVPITGSVALQIVATQQEANEPTPYALNIKPTSPANLTVDFSQQFDAYIQYNQTDTTIYHDNVDVHWQSSNPAVATVSSYGIAAGLTAGTTQITCVYGGVTSNVVTLTVVAASGAASAHGTVVDAVTQVAVPGVTVQIGSVQVDTDSNGNWTMQNVPTGQQPITYSATGYLTKTWTGWTFQPGVDNNLGADIINKITNNLITLLASGVTADYFQFMLVDASGKTAGITDGMPLSATQKLYLPDGWAFPATFWIAAFKYIGVNEVSQVALWGTLFGNTYPAGYNPAKFTGLGSYVFNLSTGVLSKTG